MILPSWYRSVFKRTPFSNTDARSSLGHESMFLVWVHQNENDVWGGFLNAIKNVQFDLPDEDDDDADDEDAEDKNDENNDPNKK